MDSSQPLITEYNITAGAKLYSSSLGNILIGCPPEILKILLSQHVPMPDTIVIPGTLHKFSSSQACLEFPFYHFLFIQQGLSRGKRFKVLAEKVVCEKLASMLRVTLLGPSPDVIPLLESKFKIPQRLDLKKMEQVMKEVQHLALKDSDKNILPIDKLVEFIPIEIDEKVIVFPEIENHPEVSITRLDHDEFNISCDLDLQYRQDIRGQQSPNYQIKGVKISAKELKSQNIFSIRCFGSSEGFDANQPANGYLLRINGKWILWDCPAYAEKHLESIGITKGDIECIFISHVHEDHLDIMQTLQEGKKVELYTSPEIYHCMLLKLSANLNCSYKEAQGYYHFNPIYANQPFKLVGAEFEVFYSCHSIPALGLKLRVPNKKGESKLFISGDTLSKRMINQLEEEGVLEGKRLNELLENFKDTVDYDLVLVDSGAGIIHGDPSDYFANSNRVMHMHTGKQIEGLPKHHGILKSGQRCVIYSG
ncbi:MAG: MBL fold metallo-hydrolase [Proteobacteria bacterium]|nr:MBL fold metallo-hydrolase [Pseudomonadota bacterium]